MGGDYGTINPKLMLGSDLSNLPFGGAVRYLSLGEGKKDPALRARAAKPAF
jgi:hypothetical protein